MGAVKGKKQTQEHINKRMEKTILKLKGRKLSDKHKINISLGAKKGKSGEHMKGRKLSEEHRKNISNSLKGHRGYWKGKSFSKETKIKMGLASKGRQCSEETKKKISIAHKANNYDRKGKKNSFYGKKHKKEALIKMSKAQEGRFGKNAANWKGGITPLVLQIRHSFKYRQWRSDVFTRDNFTCQSCGTKGCFLEAHHNFKSFSLIMKEYNIKTFEQALACEELWNTNNGLTLCKECHNLTKSFSPNLMMVEID